MAKADPQATAVLLIPANLWTDKRSQIAWIDALYSSLASQGVPIGAERLQERMSQAGMTPDELSHGIVEAREA